jgi:hypothetical protein
MAERRKNFKPRHACLRNLAKSSPLHGSMPKARMSRNEENDPKAAETETAFSRAGITERPIARRFSPPSLASSIVRSLASGPNRRQIGPGATPQNVFSTIPNCQETYRR